MWIFRFHFFTDAGTLRFSILFSPGHLPAGLKHSSHLKESPPEPEPGSPHPGLKRQAQPFAPPSEQPTCRFR